MIRFILTLALIAPFLSHGQTFPTKTVRINAMLRTPAEFGPQTPVNCFPAVPNFPRIFPSNSIL